MNFKKFKKLNRGLALTLVVILIIAIYEVVDTKKIKASEEDIVKVVENYIEEGNQVYEFEEGDIKDNKYTDSGIKKIQDRYENLINKYWYGNKNRRLSDGICKESMLESVEDIKDINNVNDNYADKIYESSNNMENIFENMLETEQVEENKIEENQTEENQIEENQTEGSQTEGSQNTCITSCKVKLQKDTVKINKKAPNMAEIEVKISAEIKGDVENMNIYNGLDLTKTNEVKKFYLLKENGEWKITAIAYYTVVEK